MAFDDDDDRESDGREWDGDCDHEETEVDVLEGIARCRCGHTRIATGAEMDAELAWQAEQAERMHAEAMGVAFDEPGPPTPEYGPAMAMADDDGIPF